MKCAKQFAYIRVTSTSLET